MRQTRLCHEFHAEQNIKCQKTECRLWDEQLPDHQHCTAVAAKEGQHTLQWIADNKMLPRMDGRGFQNTKPAILLSVNAILDKARRRTGWGRKEWVAMMEQWEMEEGE